MWCRPTNDRGAWTWGSGRKSDIRYESRYESGICYYKTDTRYLGYYILLLRSNAGRANDCTFVFKIYKMKRPSLIYSQSLHDIVYTTSTKFVPGDLARPTLPRPEGHFFPDFSLPRLLIPIFSSLRGGKPLFRRFGTGQTVPELFPRGGMGV